MRIFAIETSCDETGLALVEATGGLAAPKFRILKSVVNSQIALHRPFGGVVPNIAKREHIKNLPLALEALGMSERDFAKVDLIAVTSGPGLEPALWAGITFGRELAKKYKKPITGANHLEGHLYSFLLAKKTRNSQYQIPNIKSLFPAIGLIVSGGHTTLLELKSLTTRKKLGETRDDAVGEAFDKVARILNLPYPGGPEIERVAAGGNPKAIAFPRPIMREKNYDFSYSGLKTAVLYYMRDKGHAASNKMIADVAASFQAAALEPLVVKTMRAVETCGARSVFLSGGVAANRPLRKLLEAAARERGTKLYVADFKHNTDNAVMIAVGGYVNFLRRKRLPLVAKGDMNI